MTNDTVNENTETNYADASSDDVVDRIMHEHNAQNSEAENENIEADAESTEEVETEAEQDEAQEDDVVFPKKAVNALSRRDKQIAKYKAQNEELQKQLYELQAMQQQAAPPKQELKEPTINDFDDYESYEAARVQFLVNQILEQQNSQQKEQAQLTKEQAEQEQYLIERHAHVDAKADELMQVASDYIDVINEHGDILDSASPELEAAVLQMDNAPLAIYNLAKAGRLEAVAQMPVNLAMIELMLAEKQEIKQVNKVSSAPAPMKATKGTGTGFKEWSQKSPRELVDSL